MVNSVPKPLPPQPKTPGEIFEEADYLAYITIEFLLDPKNPATYRRGVGSGSLFEFEKNLYVLTAAHLKPPFGEIQSVWVRLKDKEYYEKHLEAEFVAYDRVLDVAILGFKEKFEYKGRLANFGKSATLKQGDVVAALGAPNQIPDCFSGGLIENPFVGMDEGTDHPGLIFYSATVRPGNSGGPLLDQYGELVGINIRIFGGNPGNWSAQAVPIDDIKNLIPKIMAVGSDWPHMILPMTILNGWDITPYGYERLGLKAPDKPGLVIMKIPAVFAEKYKDFKVGDLILKVNGEKIVNAGRFIHQIMTDVELPDSVELLIERDGETLTLKAPLMPFFK